MAEKKGFEPLIRYRIHTFQACSFDHSDTFPQDFTQGKIKGAIVPHARQLVNCGLERYRLNIQLVGSSSTGGGGWGRLVAGLLR